MIKKIVETTARIKSHADFNDSTYLEISDGDKGIQLFHFDLKNTIPREIIGESVKVKVEIEYSEKEFKKKEAKKIRKELEAKKKDVEKLQDKLYKLEQDM